MSNEIKNFIDTELPPGTAPVSLDVDAVMRGNRNARMKRRLVGGGATLASIVAVVALVLSVMTLVPSGEGVNSDDAATKSNAEDTVLDPGKKYYWDGPVSTRATEASKAYTTAFWDYFAEEHPDIDLVYGMFTDKEKIVTKDFADYSFFLSAGYELFEGDEFENTDSSVPVSERTILNLFDRNDPDTNSPSGCCGAGLRYSDDEKDTDQFELDVLPEGSFTKGTKDVLDPAFFGPKATHDSDTTTGPNGEQVQNVSVELPDDNDGGHNVARATVVYRADGSAVVVKAMSGADWGSDEEIKLSFDDMLGMALALPNDPID